MEYLLNAHQYGKAETRLVRIYRDTARHQIRDLNVSTSLRGDFAAAYLDGDQANVLPTDSQKNTAYVFALDKGVAGIFEVFVYTPEEWRKMIPKLSVRT